MPSKIPMHRPSRPARADGVRPNSNARGYDARWRALRITILQRNPMCQECGRVPSRDIDHVIAREAGGTDDPGNLRALCHGCHSRKTVKVDGGLGRPKARGQS